MKISRRNLLKSFLLSLNNLSKYNNLISENFIEVHGLSSFNELELPPNFKNLPYVNPGANKGGILRTQIKGGIHRSNLQYTQGNQNFETFDTLNIYSFLGNGAAGMEACFDTLMTRNFDEPSSMYGLLSHSVKIDPNKIIYIFNLRPEAIFHDGSALTAEDCAFSLNILKNKGHPIYKFLLQDMNYSDAYDKHTLIVKFHINRGRDSHLHLAGLPIFSKLWWEGHDFESRTLIPPLGSGPYKVNKYEQGRFIEYERVKDYWGNNLPVNIGLNNFDKIIFEYFRDRVASFESFKIGTLNYVEEYSARNWITGYNFKSFKNNNVKKIEIKDGNQTIIQGWIFNLRLTKFSNIKVREALNYAYNFEWANKNIMYSMYNRTSSYFENTVFKAIGKPSEYELRLLKFFYDKIPEELFEEPWVPSINTDEISNRKNLKKAFDLLNEAGCKRINNNLYLPNGELFKIEFLDTQNIARADADFFKRNLQLLGIELYVRQVDPINYKQRINNFDFDLIVMSYKNSLIPGNELMNLFSSNAANLTGSLNLSGISSSVIDKILYHIQIAKTYEQLIFSVRILDRILRSGKYWIPMWYKNNALISYWDTFEMPKNSPKFNIGAPDTWWWKNI